MMSDGEILTRAMKLAFEEALKSNAFVLPNPRVGAVYLKSGEIIGRGHHQKFGEAHAEIEAAGEAGNLKGSTLVVTLEPCAHKGKTPACTDFIIKNEIEHVVYGIKDPGKGGGGAKILEAAGVKVTGPLNIPEMNGFLEPYFKWVKEKRSYITLKWAMTLDGKTATELGDSRWITSEPTRQAVHALRACCDGIMVGAGTVLHDKPSLDVRYDLEGPSPRPIVWDPKAVTVSEEKWWQQMKERKPMVLTRNEQKEVWPEAVEVFKLNKLEELESLLATQHLYHVLVEGGRSLLGALFDAGVGDQVVATVATKCLGGENALPVIGGQGLEKMSKARSLKNQKIRQIEDDLWIEGYLKLYGLSV